MPASAAKSSRRGFGSVIRVSGAVSPATTGFAGVAALLGAAAFAIGAIVAAPFGAAFATSSFAAGLAGAALVAGTAAPCVRFGTTAATAGFAAAALAATLLPADGLTFAGFAAAGLTCDAGGFGAVLALAGAAALPARTVPLGAIFLLDAAFLDGWGGVAFVVGLAADLPPGGLPRLGRVAVVLALFGLPGMATRFAGGGALRLDLAATGSRPTAAAATDAFMLTTLVLRALRTLCPAGAGPQTGRTPRSEGSAPMESGDSRR